MESSGVQVAFDEVDVVTTGTFGAMCSSGAIINLGHADPPIKIQRAWINDVPIPHPGAAVDLYIGATIASETRSFEYGGAHVIEDLIRGEEVELRATSPGTDCYPRRKLETWINIADLNEAVLFNMRNAYQNYNVAVNLSDKTIYTYMGILRPQLGNANYCSAGQLSPLLNDPYYKTIGIGTKIFLGGGIGFVVWQGTQHNPAVLRTDKGVPRRGAGTLAVIGDLKQMSIKWLVGTSMLGYGCTLSVGVGVPIPILSEEILQYTTVTDDEIFAAIVDYSDAYPNFKSDIMGEVSYGQLKSGKIIVQGKEVPTASLSSYPGAVEIATTLKEWIQNGSFLLTESVAPLPGVESGITFKPLNERPIED